MTALASLALPCPAGAEPTTTTTLPPFLQADGARLVGEGGDGGRHYLHPAPQRQGATVDFWVTRVPARPEVVEGRTLVYSTALWQIDCTERTIGIRSGTEYRQKDDVTSSHGWQERAVDPGPIEPGSIGEEFFHLLCRDDGGR